MDERINQLLGKIKTHESTNNKRIKKIEKALEEIADLNLPLDSPLAKVNAANCMKAVLDSLRSSDVETVTWRLLYDAFTDVYGNLIPKSKGEALLERIDAELETIEFEAGFTKEGWVYVNLPLAFPEHDRLFLSRQFLEPVGARLIALSNSEFLTKEKCIVCVVRYIDLDSESSARDTDNLNYNNLTNLLTRAFLVDDSPRYCDFSYHSVFSSEPHIEAFIVPLKSYTKFILKLSNGSVTPKEVYKTKPNW